MIIIELYLRYLSQLGVHVDIVIQDHRSADVFLQAHAAVQYCSLGARQRSGEEWKFGATFLSLESDDWSRDPIRSAASSLDLRCFFRNLQQFQ